MRRDNLNNTMKVNRALGKKKTIFLFLVAIDILSFLLVNYIINSFANIKHFIKDKENPQVYFGLENISPKIFSYGNFIWILYLVFLLILLIGNIIFSYKLRSSYGESDINVGQDGKSRWTTLDELNKQYKKIPYRDVLFDGRGGTIISRDKDSFYIDDSFSNNIIYGTTRSGKGQMYIYPMIDVLSRAKFNKDKPSIVVTDPEIELYKSSKKTLEKRGYIVRLFNLVNPLKSMGYNPLYIAKDYYINNEPDKMQLAAKTFAHSIFHNTKDTGEKIWKDTATDLFTALIIANISDCIELDKKINKERLSIYNAKVDSYEMLNEEEKIKAKKVFYTKLEEKEKDIILRRSIRAIPSSFSFFETKENEKKINVFSCINFFQELSDRSAKESEGDMELYTKNTENALDEYFVNRGKFDTASALYNVIKNSPERTQGSVYISMQSALTIFSLESIAKMTAENSVDIKELGYGKKPIAIFLAIPSDDESKHFLATTFISQVCNHLSHLTKAGNGMLERPVKFILDEFGNMPPIVGFSSFVTEGLGRGISFDLYVQALSQISDNYKDNYKTILENFANQIYIKSIWKETAKEFAENLGTKTVIESTRSGQRFSLKKNYQEQAKERPLISENDIKLLKEGECIVYRGMKRSDNLGNAILGYPVINEYADKLSLFDYIYIFFSIFINRTFKRKNKLNPITQKCTTFFEEISIRENDQKRYKGSSLLYTHQFLAKDFPYANNINIDDINTESRVDIDYKKRIQDPLETLWFLKEEEIVKPIKIKNEKEKLFLESDCYSEVVVSLDDFFNEDYEKHLGINAYTPLLEVINAISDSRLNEKIKGTIINKLRKEAKL